MLKAYIAGVLATNLAYLLLCYLAVEKHIFLFNGVLFVSTTLIFFILDEKSWPGLYQDIKNNWFAVGFALLIGVCAPLIVFPYPLITKSLYALPSIIFFYAGLRITEVARVFLWKNLFRS